MKAEIGPPKEMTMTIKTDAKAGGRRAPDKTL
jgi:hypothetical protein